jgi:hypothetical protein
MAPIDDLGEPWQTLPAVGSDEARNINTLAEAAPGPFKVLRERIRSAVER